MSRIMEGLNTVVPAIKNSVKEIVEGVTFEIEKRAMIAGKLYYFCRIGNLTRDGMETVMQTVLEKAGIIQIIKRFDEPTQPESKEKEISNFSDSQLYLWNGAFHCLPEDYKLPIVTCRNAWSLWCCGDPSKNIPPLRFIKPADLKEVKERKRLSDFKFVMQRIEENLEIEKNSLNSCSVEKIQEIFKSTEHALRIDSRTEKNRKRRLEQLSWTSAAVILRNKR